MKLLGVICWLTKHKWRRLRKAERELESGTYLLNDESASIRICDRCHATKTVRQRKLKP